MFQRTLSTLVAVVMLALIAAGASVAAEELRVPEDHSTIQRAVDQAANGDTIVINDGTYTENITIENRMRLTIEARNEGRVTLQSRFSSAVIEIKDSQEIAFVDLTITSGTEIAQDGSAQTPVGNGGVLIQDSSKISFDTVTLSDNLGPGLILDNATEITLTDSFIRNNQETSTFIRNGETVDNEITKGHGIEMMQRSSVTLDTVVVDNNQGSGIFLSEASSATVLDESQINNNLGPGVEITDGSRATIQGTSVLRNNLGAGLKLEDEAGATLNDVIVEGTRQDPDVDGDPGDGIRAEMDSRVVLKDVTVQQNSGSGIFLDLSTTLVANSTLINNLLNGITAENQSTVEVSDNSEISDNRGFGLRLLDSTSDADALASDEADRRLTRETLVLRAADVPGAVLSDTLIERNESTAVSLEFSDASLTQVDVRNNGGSYAFDVTINATLSVSDGKITDNTSSTGVLNLVNESSAAFQDVEIRDNQGTVVFNLLDQSTLSLDGTNNIINENSGNVLVVDDSTALLFNARIEDNTGNAVHAKDSSVLFSGVKFLNQRGNGIVLESSTAQLMDVELRNHNGLSLSAVSGSTVSVFQSLFSDNDAGITINASSLTVQDTEILSNRGIGISVSEGSTVSLTGVTLNNHPQGGVELKSASSLRVANSEIRANGGVGLSASDRSTVTIRNSEITNHNDHGVSLLQSSLEGQSLMLLNNGGDGIHADND